MAAERTRVLLGCYPNGKPSDPEVYASAVAAVLAQYPPEIVFAVTDPRIGIVRRCKFMPSIAEIVSACDDEMRPIIRAWKDDQQIAAREEANKPANKTMVERFNGLLASITAYCAAPYEHNAPGKPTTTEAEREAG